MRRRPFAPSVDPLEARLALSTLSTPTYLGVKEAIDRALVGLSRTGDLQRANAVINRAASRIPDPGGLLPPLWEAELATVSRRVPGSALRARRDMFLMLDAHLHRGVEAGAITVRGPAARHVSRPAVQALYGDFIFSNYSSYTLEVSIVEVEGGRVVDRRQVGSQVMSTFKLPLEPGHRLEPPAVFTVSVARADGGGGGSVRLADLADRQVLAINAQRPGEIELRVLESGF